MKKAICSRCIRFLPIVARGFCNSCYIAWRRKNNPEAAKRERQQYIETHQEHIRVYQEQWRLDNRDALLKRSKEIRRNTPPEVLRDRSLRAAYGITSKYYQTMFDSQGGLCAICRGEQNVASPNGSKNLHVDHDHDTGIIRGLLCGRCNIALGYVEQSEWLEKAINYIKS